MKKLTRFFSSRGEALDGVAQSGRLAEVKLPAAPSRWVLPVTKMRKLLVQMETPLSSSSPLWLMGMKVTVWIPPVTRLRLINLSRIWPHIELHKEAEDNHRTKKVLQANVWKDKKIPQAPSSDYSSGSGSKAASEML